MVRERDLLAGPCIVLPGPFRRFAERRRVRLTKRHDFGWLVARIRSGPPPGFFRIGWVRSFPNLNEFFVHHQDVRQGEWDGRSHAHARVGSRVVAKRLPGEPTARLSGPPGELLLYLFGRQRAAHVDVRGPAPAVAALHRTHFGM